MCQQWQRSRTPRRVCLACNRFCCARRGESAWHAIGSAAKRKRIDVIILIWPVASFRRHIRRRYTQFHGSSLSPNPAVFQPNRTPSAVREGLPFGRGLNHPHSRDVRSPGRSVHGPRPPRARSLNAPANARAVERLLHCRRQRTPIDALRHCVGWPSDTLKRRAPARSAANMRDTRPTRYIFILHGHPLSCNNPFPLRAQPLPPSPPHPPSDRCSFPPSPSR